MVSEVQINPSKRKSTMTKTIEVTETQADLISFCVQKQMQNQGLPKTFMKEAEPLLDVLDNLDFKSK